MTGNQYSVLIVDDNPDTLKIIGTFLQKEGYAIRFAQNGYAATESAVLEPPDLILLDVSMPGIDGYETCRRIRSIEKLAPIPIIFITAEKKGAESMLEGFKAGAVDYIEKPVESTVIAARVQLHISLLQARRELEERNKELEAINDWKTRLLSILGHDLRNPIAGFLGLTEVILKDFDAFPKETLQEYIQELHKAALNTEAILENVLSWARLSKQSIVKPVSFSVHNLIMDVFDQMATLARQKNITLNMPSMEDAFAYADPEMTETIIRNFIANGIKFTPKGGTIQVNWTDQGALLEISVIDTGIGMNLEKHQCLFTTKIQSERGTEGEKGSGLGLIICKELAEKMGGSVGAESTEGKGSRFWLRLPKKSL
ncbi:MAG: hybrid sensor histidine kinase/response regulator [Treponema sp.]|nr:hybrid sensor histidine kinase/response regulator [Treponema sp.]